MSILTWVKTAIDLRQKERRLELERSRLMAIQKMDFAEEIRISKMIIGEGDPWRVELEGRALKPLAMAMIAWFKDSGGTNFVEVDIESPEDGCFTLLMQRKDGALTPAQKCVKLEKSLRDVYDAAQSALDTL